MEERRIHVINYVGGITDIGIRHMIGATLEAQSCGATEIELRLSSLGGSLAMGFTAYNHLRSLNVPLTTINTGNVESAAVLLYLAADVRLTFPHTTWLFHGFTWTFDAGECTLPVMRERVDSLDSDMARYAEIVYERTQERLDIRSKLSGGSTRIDPAVAASLGITTAPARVTAIPANVTNYVIQPY